MKKFLFFLIAIIGMIMGSVLLVSAQTLVKKDSISTTAPPVKSRGWIKRFLNNGGTPTVTIPHVVFIQNQNMRFLKLFPESKNNSMTINMVFYQSMNGYFYDLNHNMDWEKSWQFSLPFGQ